MRPDRGCAGHRRIACDLWLEIEPWLTNLPNQVFQQNRPTAVSDGDESQRPLNNTVRTLGPLGSTAVDGPFDTRRSHAIDRNFTSGRVGLPVVADGVALGRDPHNAIKLSEQTIIDSCQPSLKI